MKKLIYILCLLTLPMVSRAQMVVSDPTGAYFQAQSVAVQTASKLLSESSVSVLTDVAKYAQSAYSVAQDYQNALGAVNKYIANTAGVKNMFVMQGKIAQLYSDNYNKFNSNLDAESLNVYQGGLKKALTESLKCIQDLDIIITADFAKMTDAERMSVISDIEKRMKYNYDGANAVVNTYKRMYNHIEFHKGTKNYIR